MPVAIERRPKRNYTENGTVPPARLSALRGLLSTTTFPEEVIHDWKVEVSVLDFNQAVTEENYANARKIAAQARIEGISSDPLKEGLLNLPESERPFFVPTVEEVKSLQEPDDTRDPEIVLREKFLNAPDTVDPRVRRLHDEQGIDVESLTRSEFLQTASDLLTGKKNNGEKPVNVSGISSLLQEYYEDKCVSDVLIQTIDSRIGLLSGLNSESIRYAERYERLKERMQGCKEKSEILQIKEELAQMESDSNRLDAAQQIQNQYRETRSVLEGSLTSLGNLGSEDGTVKLYEVTESLFDRKYTTVKGDHAGMTQEFPIVSTEIGKYYLSPISSVDDSQSRFTGLFTRAMTSLLTSIRKNADSVALLVDHSERFHSWKDTLTGYSGFSHPAVNPLSTIMWAVDLSQAGQKFSSR